MSTNAACKRHGTLPRREFLLFGTTATAVGLVGLATLHESVLAEDKDEKDKTKRKIVDLEHTHFEKYVDEQFIISRESKAYGKQSAVFTLVEAKHHKNTSDKRRPSEVREFGFSLLFRAETGEKLEDGIWTVSHPKIGYMDLFLHKTQHDKEPERVFFVAAFN